MFVSVGSRDSAVGHGVSCSPAMEKRPSGLHDTEHHRLLQMHQVKLLELGIFPISHSQNVLHISILSVSSLYPPSAVCNEQKCKKNHPTPLLLASRMLLQSVTSRHLHPSNSVGDQTHRRRTPGPSLFLHKYAGCPSKNDGDGSNRGGSGHVTSDLFFTHT